MVQKYVGPKNSFVLNPYYTNVKWTFVALCFEPKDISFQPIVFYKNCSVKYAI